MIQNQIFELTFSGAPIKEDYADIDLFATFHTDGAEDVTVQGFYDGTDARGNGICRIRFLPETAGEYSWSVTGLFHESGRETCHKSPEKGIVRASGFHFEYSDGTLFTPIGTTVYALAHQDEDTTEATLTTLEHAPFNKVRMCVFPKSYVYNQNEPPFYPFLKKNDGSWDVSSPDLRFWQRLERIIERISAAGIQVDLILFHPYDRWGFESLPQKDNLVYLKYLLARLSAYPDIWWSIANEYDVCPDKTMDDWHEIEEFTYNHDPFRHLLSCHNCFAIYDAKRPAITHASVQTKNCARVSELREFYNKPVVIDECGYEGNIPEFFGCLSAYEMTARMWRVFVTGGYCTHGETFLDRNDILWWAKGGVLKGQSPARITFMRQIIEELPGPVDPVPNRMLAALSPASRVRAKAALPHLPKDQQGMIRGLLLVNPLEIPRLSDSEMMYNGHIGEEVFLTFYDLRCSAKDTIVLPKDKRYNIELIDVMNMTRETVAENVSGSVEIDLPGHEGMLSIARRC